jgi:hypothetical protein
MRCSALCVVFTNPLIVTFLVFVRLKSMPGGLEPYLTWLFLCPETCLGEESRQIFKIKGHDS